jgi:asparagine synthase (glutamine-hydrolysing)
MCGIAGVWDRAAIDASARLEAMARAMADAIRHRGPDGDGLWLDSGAGLALAHRRLAIIDLTPTGAQPMASASGRYVITFNGEIFNYQDLRRELADAGCRFRSTSDTEVILEGCVRWGIEATLQRLVGMFAFALWDRHDRRLHLVRDRLGIKPIYYLQRDRLFLFGSELKALRAAPGWSPEIDRNAVVGFLRHAYVPAPLTIYQDVAKLPPGSHLTVGANGAVTVSRYWDIHQVAIDGIAKSRHIALPAAEGETRLDALLRDAVRLRMISDVPLGAFLSGGIDSSTVVALMQAQSTRPVKTFSIGFREAGYDESGHAGAVARHLGTDHTELIVEPQHALETIPKIPDWYDEPFADSSQIPTFLVSELARRQVTVALSGDGGDELFAGYNRYFWGTRLWSWVRGLPYPVRKAAASAMAAIPVGTWDGLQAALPDRLCPPQLGDKVRKVASLVGSMGPDAIYRELVSQWNDPQQIAGGGIEPSTPLWDGTIARSVPDFVDRMQLLDFMTYLPDDILTKVDRATMAVSLEGRVPLLDHRVVEFAWTLPQSLKVRSGGKWLLKRVLARYVPAALTNRPKMGFGVPIDSWLRGPLRDWAECLLAPEALKADGLLRPEPIRELWAAHLRGAAGHYRLWPILMLQAWRQRWA